MQGFSELFGANLCDCGIIYLVMEKHLLIVDFAGGKSKVWKYFGFWKSGAVLSKDKAVGKICKCDYAYTSNTTTLCSHIMMKHPECQLSDVEKRGQQSITSMFNKNSSGSSAIPLSQQKMREYTQAICHFLIEDVGPISTVDGSGFLEMIHRFEPR